MDGDVVKLVLTALGSGGAVGLLFKVLGPALKLTTAGNEASARAIAQWEALFKSQKEETAAALCAVKLAKETQDKADARAEAAERRALAAERKTTRIEAELQRAVERIRHLEEQLKP